VSDIQTMIFGGSHSRFWLLRKHFNSMTEDQLDKVLFHNWDCISLELPGREVNLVIPDMDDMNHLLKFLIYKMRTLDGEKGSANNVLNLLNEET